VHNDHKQITAELATYLKCWICNTWPESREYDPKRNILYLNLSQLTLVRFTKVARK